MFYAERESFRWISGETNIAIYGIAGPAQWYSSFCRTCGSPLLYMDSEEKFYFVPAGLLDDDPGFRGYAAHIFVGSKAPWVCITDDAPQYVEGFGSARIADRTRIGDDGDRNGQ